MARDQDFDLEAFLPYLLSQAAEESSLAFQRIYKGRYGMLRTEWRVLFHLGIYGPMTATEIGQKAKTHKTKISRAVSALSHKRFVTRARDEADRRSETLALTPSGEAAYRDLRAEAQAYDAALINRLTAAEARLIRGALLRLAQLDRTGERRTPGARRGG